MKKIYSKMTKNRTKSFQIETYITQENNGEKKVYKKALSEEAKEHVNRIYKRYLSYENKDIVCETIAVCDGVVAFPFIWGESLNSELLGCLECKDKQGFEEKLELYRDLVDASAKACEKPYEENEESQKIFGVGLWPFDCKYVTGLNIDMCFDNIIHAKDKYQIIDYEWVFDFPLPVNFVIYRAIWALYVRYNEQLKGLYSWKDLCNLFGIKESEVLLYEEMNTCFTNYVYGGETGYSATLLQYKKKVCSMEEIKSKIEEPGNYVQLFADLGEGYSEECSKKYDVSSRKIEITFDVSQYCTGKEFRIDPSIYPFVCKKNITIEVTDKFGNQYKVEDYKTEGCLESGELLLFISQDPQLKFSNKWMNRIKTVTFSCEVLKYLTAEEMPVFVSIRQQEEQNRKEREKMLEIKHALEQRLTEAVSKIMLMEFDGK